jgi:hypothetical protein
MTTYLRPHHPWQTWRVHLGLVPAEQLAARLPTVHFPMGLSSATSAVDLVC